MAGLLYPGPRIDFHVHLSGDAASPREDGSGACGAGHAWFHGVLGEVVRLVAKVGRTPSWTRVYPEFSEAGFRELVKRFDSHGRDRLLLELDRYHVSRAVICSIEPFLDTRDLAHTLASNRDRLALFASVDPSLGDPVDRLERMVASHRIQGLKLHPPLAGPHPLSPRMFELGSWAERRGLPIFVHAGTFPFPLHGHHDDVADLEPFLRRIQDVPIVLGHIGWDQHRTVLDLARTYRHVHVETSWQPAAIIRQALDALGPHRVLMGSDFPLQPLGTAIAEVERACENRSEGRLVMHDNAAAMIGWPLVGEV